MDKSEKNVSILEAAHGAILERVDYELNKVIQNIMDPNTRADKKRQVTVILDLVPDAERRKINVSAVSKSKLEPTNAIQTSLYICGDEDGELSVVEMVAQLPGQQNAFGGEQESPKIIKLAR